MMGHKVIMTCVREGGGNSHRGNVKLFNGDDQQSRQVEAHTRETIDVVPIVSSGRTLGQVDMYGFKLDAKPRLFGLKKREM
jgi:hypothetical protein